MFNGVTLRIHGGNRCFTVSNVGSTYSGLDYQRRYMPAQGAHRPERHATVHSGNQDTRPVSGESLVLRNYDDSTHDVHIACTDRNGETAFTRTVSVGPQDTVSVQTRLDRAVYRVGVRLDNGATDRADCVLGSDPNECAKVETGNGVVSVVEGYF